MSAPTYLKVLNTDTGNMEQLAIQNIVDGQYIARSGNTVTGDPGHVLSGHINDPTIHRLIFTKSVQLNAVAGTERPMIFRTHKQITFGYALSIVRGSAGPSVTWNINFSSDLSGLSEQAFVFAGDQTTSSTSIGDTSTPDNNPIEAGYWIWLALVGITGTVDEFAITLYLQETGL
jgi:hypothetical protein